MTNAVDITISDVRNFKSCRRRWDFRSSLRRNLEPINEGPNLAFGKAVHLALTEWYIGSSDDPVAVFRNEFRTNRDQLDQKLMSNEMREKYERFWKMGPKLLVSYVRWAKKNDDFKVIDVEQRLAVRLNNVTPGIFFSWRFDMLVERSDGLWLLDFKTSARPPTDTSWLQVDDQAIAYQWATEQALGKPIQGMIYQYVYKKMPLPPKLTKTGTISKAKIVTTYLEYFNALKRYGKDPADFQMRLQDIDEQESTRWFKRVYVKSTPEQRRHKHEELRRITAIMADPDVFIYPVAGQRNCAACDFKIPCHTMDAADIGPTLDMFYKQREPRE